MFLRGLTLILALAFLEGSTASAQSPSVFYGRPSNPFAAPTAGTPGTVVYGTGTGSPVTFGTPGSIHYSPGYMTTNYRYQDALYTPPGFFEAAAYATPTYATRPTYTYTPGYLSYLYRPSPFTPSNEVRPSYSRPRVYTGYAGTYR